jgi:hypothetical protein
MSSISEKKDSTSMRMPEVKEKKRVKFALDCILTIKRGIVFSEEERDYDGDNEASYDTFGNSEEVILSRRRFAQYLARKRLDI